MQIVDSKIDEVDFVRENESECEILERGSSHCSHLQINLAVHIPTAIWMQTVWQVLQKATKSDPS